MNSNEIEIAFGRIINKIRSESGKGGKKKNKLRLPKKKASA